MKHIRMTMLSRLVSRYSMTAGAILVALAACVFTHPLHAQQFTPRDSALLKGATVGKQTSDSLGLLVCVKPSPPAKSFCSAFPRLLQRARSSDSLLFGIASVPAPATRVDTIKLAGKTDTVRTTVIKTVHDTTRITTIVTIHDTVLVGSKAPVVASVSTSLTDRTLDPGQTTQAKALVKDSAGNTLSRSVVWTSTATNVAAVSDSGLVTAVSPGSSAIRATVDSKSSYATVTVATIPLDTVIPPPPPPPPPPIDTSKKGIVLGLLGPTIPPSAIPAQFAFYEQNFKHYADSQWTAFGPRWDAGNSIAGYERGAIYYAWWARTGDTTYYNRAHAIVVDYRDNYLVPAGYGAQPHWSQMESMYLDCELTGDVKSCTAIDGVYGRMLAWPGSGYFDASQGDARIQMRVMDALWVNEKMTGVHSALLDSSIVRALTMMNANGFTGFASTCGGDLNYMSGMLHEWLNRIHDQRPMAMYNSLIETKSKAWVAHEWATEWRGAQGDPSFNYVSLLCDGTGGQSSAPDLNGFILPVFGWVGRLTGDPTWFTRGDQILAGMQTTATQAGASVYLYKQFSESYIDSYRDFGYRWPASALRTAASARTIARRVPVPSARTKPFTDAELERLAAEEKRTRALEAAQHDSLVAARVRKPSNR